MFDIVALGESLMDCVPMAGNAGEMPVFQANPGGAPANVLAMDAKLGGSTAFIGMVGEDAFGHRIGKTLEQAGIDTRGLLYSPDYNTTLAFVQLDEKGDRSFSFYRSGCADVMLSYDCIDPELLKNCRVFHFGSVSMTTDPCRTATLEAARAAKAAGAVISYDPNYRPLLWADTAEAARWMREGAVLADVVKVSDEELALITDETDLEAGAKKLQAMGPAAVFVTMGEKGSYFAVPAGTGTQPAFPVHAVDTTGAGDSFFGALLYGLRGKTLADLRTMTLDEWNAAVRFANATGGLTTEHKGAIPAMPTLADIEAALAGQRA